MSKPAIEVKNLSKVYNIGHERKSSAGTVTLRDAITNVVRKPAELVTGHKLKKEKFWALKDINFEVQSGDVVGIIGRNGSGKSTLLKVMSRIVEPTNGEIIMRGKTASLLEVGTGFHPELTGRENIYFNGSILGMKKKEIEAKFDEIVAFSEVEKFLDTPVKFYSSGMYVRLAFAVAAHLEPDILIVDEVLAVGDAAFQQKCLGKMRDVAGQGRTVLFVSHNMASVRSLCSKGILLDGGRIVATGDMEESISIYSKKNHISNEDIFKNINSSNSHIGIHGLTMTAERNKLSAELVLMSKEDIPGVYIGFGLGDSGATRILTLLSRFAGTSFDLKKGKNIITCDVEQLNLKPGNYTADIFVGTNTETLLHMSDPISFEIKKNDFYINGLQPDDTQGNVVVNQLWKQK